MKNAKLPKKGLTLKQKEACTGYLFILLPLVSLIIMMYYPIIRSFFISFFEWNLLQEPTFVGFGNYKTLIHDEVFKTALCNTVKWVLIYVPMSVISSFLLALLLDRKMKGAGFFRTLYYLPVVCPIVVVSLLFVWIYNTDYGILNFILKELFHMDPIGWLTDSKYSLFAIAIMSVWKWAGYNMLIFLSALQGIDESLYEAAAIDGISPLQKLIYIKIPLVMPSIYFVMLTAVIDAFQMFTEIFIMTKGGPGYSTYTVSYYLWSNAFEYQKMGYACAMAAVMFVIILAVTLLQDRVMNKKVQYDE
ncbi:carbohydrate ABC transporter permease [Bariatricus sp. HCP28S3_C2]|uniref:carbohydrate ABC transporter permease n=1 Tax=unclassified Bariatricus TaxID=2677046 RepID=UPI002A98360C|nr:sugar ABC transporter permease [bacterium]MDY5457713.1 sugar ABC transporter permease [Bariatricus sp.]